MNTTIVLFAMAAACISAPALAKERMPLGGGATLALTEKELVLIGAGGKRLAALPMRAEQLDVRVLHGSGVALVLDSATQHARLVRVDATAGTLLALPSLPVQSFGVESLCLFRDRQQLDYVFVAAKDGQAEQWLVHGDKPLLVRKLSMPLNTEQCKVDDGAHTLYVDESGVGTWAYEADAEAAPARALLKSGTRRSLAPDSPAVVVRARVQTDPVAQLGDVADDPAIWVHPSDGTRSRVLGTNKKQGLMVYDLQGKQLQFLPSGRLNNVDIRQRVQLGGRTYDLALATQRDDNSVVIYQIDAQGQVAELSRIATGLQEVYGTCLFQPREGGLQVIVNDKSGQFRQFALSATDSIWSGALVRSFKLASQPEGCVADDRRERLFIGEEKRGIWTVAARADVPARPQMVLGVGRDLRPDVEGMAIYHGSNASWLIVSSQGDNSYVVLDALAPFKVRGRFKVGVDPATGIDGASETDGLDVTSHNLGGAFARGMLVLQDGYKRMPDGPQNFKYVSWDDVATALTLEPVGAAMP